MRIAIVGAGISGLVSAHLLHREHDIFVYEANDYIGGHTRTVDEEAGGVHYPVDTGFIVFNEKTYPNFVKLLKRLDVPWQPSRMSFSVRCGRTGLEYSPSSFNALFAQRRNLLRPAFLRMLLDILRFRRASVELIQALDDELTLEDYIRNGRYSSAFSDYFLIPMGSAIWSADPIGFRDFPARYFALFFHNHGFLQLRDQPQWLVVKGGSRQYVAKLIAPFRDRIRTGCPVQAVSRHKDHVALALPDGSVERYDHCIIATHSDQALAMLADPTDPEKAILGAIPYQRNTTILHTDASMLPTRRVCWASWNAFIPPTERRAPTLTYNMNILQSLPAPVDFCVTLNMEEDIEPDKVRRRMVYHHPAYKPGSLAAQGRFREISGTARTHYCGAYWGYGFHEDGVKSALAACEPFGVRW